MNTSPRGKLTFPCEFTFKIVGLANNEFEMTVLKILHSHFPQLGESAIIPKFSKNGKYVAYTVQVYAISQAQLDATYLDLCAHPLVLFVL